MFICKVRSCKTSFEKSIYQHHFGEEGFQLLSSITIDWSRSAGLGGCQPGDILPARIPQNKKNWYLQNIVLHSHPTSEEYHIFFKATHQIQRKKIWELDTFLPMYHFLSKAVIEIGGIVICCPFERELVYYREVCSLQQWVYSFMPYLHSCGHQNICLYNSTVCRVKILLCVEEGLDILFFFFF